MCRQYGVRYCARQLIAQSISRWITAQANREQWVRNLAAIWAVEALAISGFYASYALTPIFLTRELGVPGGGALAYWSGLAAGLSGLCMAIVSPAWGWVADKVGRKRILIFALAAIGVTVAAMALVTTPEQVVAISMLQGACGGTVAIATAMVATGSPTRRLGWALGVLNASFAVGGVIGPLVAAGIASAVGFRAAFAVGGSIYFMAIFLALLTVKEGRRITADVPVAHELGTTMRGRTRAVAALIAAQALLAMGYTTGLQLVIVRVATAAPTAATVAAGTIYAAIGLATFVSALLYSRIAGVLGYRRFAIFSAVILVVWMAVTTSPSLVLVGLGAIGVGLVYGGLSPAIGAMIGIETPRRLHATSYSIGASAIAIGFGVGPLMSGRVGLTWGVTPAQFVALGFGLVLCIVLVTLVREPVPDSFETGPLRGRKVTDGPPQPVALGPERHPSE